MSLDYADRLLSLANSLLEIEHHPPPISFAIPSHFLDEDFEFVIPTVIQRALEMGADLCISISGGKDSQALLMVLTRWWRQQGFTGKIFAIFCDLGRIEWSGAWEWCRKLCRDAGVELIVVRREQGGMIDNWWERRATLEKDGEAIPLFSNFDEENEGEITPHWSSASARYCTYQQKTNTSNKVLRKTDGIKPHWSSGPNRYCTKGQKSDASSKTLRDSHLVICALGLRAEEGTEREKKPVVQVRSDVTTKLLKEPKGLKESADRQAWAEASLDKWLEMDFSKKIKPRLGFNWNPLHAWLVEQVWRACGTTNEDIERRRELFRQGRYREALENAPVHWSYIASSSRMSCSMCVLGSRHDLTCGAIHNPMGFRELLLQELGSNCTFQSGFGLYKLAVQVLHNPPEKRRELYEILYELKLVTAMSGPFALEAIVQFPTGILMFWLESVWRDILDETLIEACACFEVMLGSK